MPVWLTPVLGFLGPLLDRFIPDAGKRQEFQQQLALLASQQAGEQLHADLQMALGQLDVNKIEAASPSFFKSGWRPATGWVCVCGLAYTFIAWPFWKWLCDLYHFPVPPALDISTLMGLLVPLLGLAGYRTIERINGKA